MTLNQPLEYMERPHTHHVQVQGPRSPAKVYSSITISLPESKDVHQVRLIKVNDCKLAVVANVSVSSVCMC